MVPEMEKKRCPICGESNLDVLEEHLAALVGEGAEEGELGPPLYITLCVNCHRIIHRCCWTLIGDISHTIVDKFFVFLDSLPTPLGKRLQNELRAAMENVTLQYLRAGIVSPEIKSEKRCVLCGNINPDLLEEHLVVSHEEQTYLNTDIIADLCASCHRIILKFYEGKVLPSSSESKVLLHKYLDLFEEYLPGQVKQDLIQLIARIEAEELPQ